MLDIFAFISRYGMYATRWDWRHQVFGYDELISEKLKSVLLGNGIHDAYIEPRSPAFPQHKLVLLQTNEALWGFDEVTGERHQIDDVDLAALKIQPENLGRWLVQKLALPQAMRNIEYLAPVIVLSVSPVPILLALPSLPFELEKVMATQVEKFASQNLLLLTCSKSAVKLHRDILSAPPYSKVRIVSVTDFVQWNTIRHQYEYAYSQPFVDYIEAMKNVPTGGTFMERPAGMGWKNLEIRLVSDDKAEDGSILHDILIAQYFDDNNNSVDYHWLPVKSIKELHGRPSLKNRGKVYGILRRIARTGGYVSNGSSTDAKNFSFLRDSLRAMFGYTQGEDPFPNKTGNDKVVEPALRKIAFSSTSDPILREAAKRPLEFADRIR